MKVFLQRVNQASVTVDNEVVGAIERGVVLLVGFCRDDTAALLKPMAEKIATLRIFPSDKGEFDRSVVDIHGGALLVSQFTLYGDVRKGRRPDWYRAMPQEDANLLYQEFVNVMKSYPINVQQGVFRAHMFVKLENEGPVSLMIEM